MISLYSNVRPSERAGCLVNNISRSVGPAASIWLWDNVDGYLEEEDEVSYWADSHEWKPFGVESALALSWEGLVNHLAGKCVNRSDPIASHSDIEDDPAREGGVKYGL
jgi:hypothetical protein